MQPATFTASASFCERIQVSDGHITRIVEPHAPVEVRPSSDTQYVLTPVGKLGFQGQPRMTKIQVVYPVEIEATASRKITLPNQPVTISWRAKNHTQILLLPGRIDVTNLASYDIRPKSKIEHSTRPARPALTGRVPSRPVPALWLPRLFPGLSAKLLSSFYRDKFPSLISPNKLPPQCPEQTEPAPRHGAHEFALGQTRTS